MKLKRDGVGRFVKIVNGKEVRITRLELLRAAMRRIRAQFPATPEARLCCAVIEQATKDTTVKSERDAAIRYLKGDLWHAQLCGVEPEWIQATLEEMDCFEALV